jgi:hypothetical protein
VNTGAINRSIDSSEIGQRRRELLGSQGWLLCGVRRESPLRIST